MPALDISERVFFFRKEATEVMSVIKSRHIMQVNIVVDDIERVGRNYAKTFGIEMPEIWCHPGPNQAVFMYNGVGIDRGGGRAEQPMERLYSRARIRCAQHWLLR